MKLKGLIAILVSSCALWSQPLAAQELSLDQAQGPLVVILVDPEELSADFPKDESATDSGPLPSESENHNNRGSIEDLIEQVRREQMTLNDYEKRVLSIVEREQKSFLEGLEVFLKSSFNRDDPASSGEFAASTKRLVHLVFKSPTDRAFYSRIYLINKIWLEHPGEKARFDFLDKLLQEESLRIESRNRKIRQGLMGVTTVAGLSLGAYLGYKAAYGIVKVAANETGLASVSKMALRVGIIAVTATTGAAAGSVVGYLGSDLLLSNSRELLDPIDGDEHLKELLEYIDDL